MQLPTHNQNATKNTKKQQSPTQNIPELVTYAVPELITQEIPELVTQRLQNSSPATLNSCKEFMAFLFTKLIT